MRVALLADIHGNSIALDAVLKDIHSKGNVDAYWLMGDYVAIGHDPVGCLERISELKNAVYTMGNTDRYLTRDLSLEKDFENASGDLTQSRAIASAHINFAWTQGAITAAGWKDWIAELPLEHRSTLEDGSRFLGVHASPGSDDSAGLHPKQDDGELARLFGKDAADLICVAHTHVAMDLAFHGKRLVNVSSVSNPFPPDLGASYAILDNKASGYSLEMQSVDYDHEAVIQAVKKIQHPAADYIIGFMRGENVAGWMS